MYPEDITKKEAEFCTDMALDMPKFLINWDENSEVGYFDHLFMSPFESANWLLRQIGVLKALKPGGCCDELVIPAPTQKVLVESILKLDFYEELTKKVIFEYILVTYIDLFTYRYGNFGQYDYFSLEEISEGFEKRFTATRDADLDRFCSQLHQFGVLEKKEGKYRWRQEFYPHAWEVVALNYTGIHPVFVNYMEDFLLRMPEPLQSLLDEIKHDARAIKKFLEQYSFLGYWRSDGYDQPIGGITNVYSDLHSSAIHFIMENY